MITSLKDSSLSSRVSQIQCFPGEQYVRTAARNIHYCSSEAARFNSHYFANITAVLEPQGVYRIREAMVRGTGIISLGEAIIRENLVENQDVGVLEQSLQRDENPVRVVEEPVLYVVRMGIRNYGHCLTDIVPRMCWFHERYPSVKIVVHKDTPATILDAMQACGIDRHSVFKLGDEVTELKAMYFMDQWNRGPLCHSWKIFEHLKRLKEVVTKTPAERTEYPRRIFVTRADAKKRHISNHDKVSCLLRSRGFHEIACGSMSFQEQVRHFDAAEWVVGLAGAALANMVFCKPGSDVMVLAPDTMPSIYFWDMAHHAKLALHLAYFAPSETRQGANSDFTVDIDVLQQSLPE